MKRGPAAGRLRRVRSATACLCLSAAGLVPPSPATALSCSTSQVSIAEVALQSDRIVVGTVNARDGDCPWTYTITVERVVKGPPLGATWVIPDAHASDCGMPRLDVGRRVVLEYREPGTVAHRALALCVAG